MPHPYTDDEKTPCPYCGRCKKACGTEHRVLRVANAACILVILLLIFFR